MPAARNGVQNREETNQRSADIDRGLHNVGPDHGGHAALKRIDQCQHGDDSNRRQIAPEVAHTAERG